MPTALQSVTRRLGLPERRMFSRDYGAAERTRTSTVLLPPAPQAGASASSATTASTTQYSRETRFLHLAGRPRSETSPRLISLAERAPVARAPGSASNRKAREWPERERRVLARSAPASKPAGEPSCPVRRPYRCAAPSPERRP